MHLLQGAAQVLQALRALDSHMTGISAALRQSDVFALAERISDGRIAQDIAMYIHFQALVAEARQGRDAAFSGAAATAMAPAVACILRYVPALQHRHCVSKGFAVLTNTFWRWHATPTGNLGRPVCWKRGSF